MKITVEEFATTEKKSLERFVKWWHKQSKKEPLHFPKNLQFGDWIDQFFSYYNEVELDKVLPDADEVKETEDDDENFEGSGC